jgi:type VI secretion system protein ImpF
MAASDRVLPDLLDRLTSDGTVAGHDSRSSAPVSLRQYQQSVLRDLGWLLNARSTLPEDVAVEFPEIARSVLNFGTRDFCGIAVSSVDLIEVEHELMDAIQCFEPRIIRGSLSVKAVPPSEPAGLNVVAFEIRGEVWAVPFPEQVFIRTELDLETGQYELK